MSEKRFCLQCDDGTLLVHEVRDLDFTYRDQQSTVSAVAGWHCPVCGDCEFDTGEGKRYSAAVDAFAAAVDMEKKIDIEAVAKAIEADAGQPIEGLRESLAQAKAGIVGRVTTPAQILVRQAREKS